MEFYVGQVCWFAFNYAPKGWAMCHGQSMPIMQYQTLYAVLGTTYGGDGVTTFNLPDLRDRMATGSENGRAGGTSPTTYAATESSAGTHSVPGSVQLNPCICLNGLFPQRS